jgi:formylglycine-generating enzyme required for sulfatase activity
VEQVTWVQCTALLSRMGLELPSEAQWEYACRGGTETPWWSGTERESLRGSLNIADQAAARAGGEWPQIKDWPDFDDGWPVHAPVGSMRANPFGLHEIVGNVWEWCRDVYAPYTEGELTDPEGPSQEFTDRVIRGGSFDGDAGAARSARRNLAPDVSEDDSLGLRPARRIAP